MFNREKSTCLVGITTYPIVPIHTQMQTPNPCMDKTKNLINGIKYFCIVIPADSMKVIEWMNV